MCGSSETQVATTPRPQCQLQENTSGGFHLIEVHMPTVGVGMITIVVIIAIIFTAMACYRYIKRRADSRRFQPPFHPAPWHQMRQRWDNDRFEEIQENPAQQVAQQVAQANPFNN